MAVSANDKIVRGGDLATIGAQIKAKLAEKVSSENIDNMLYLTSAEYEALATKDPNTIYVVTDGGAELYPQDGKSAYQIWLDEGNTGTEADFLESLKGPVGPTGPQGVQGPVGPQGIQGPQGNTGSSIDYPFTLVNNLTEGGTDSALTAEQGKIIGTELFGYDFGASGTYYCWVEKLYSLLNRNGTESDQNNYGYTCQIPATGEVTITRPATGRWKVFFYQKMGDTSGVNESAWVTTDSSSITIPNNCSAIRIIFESASGYVNADYLDYRFTITGALPYGAVYTNLVRAKETENEAATAANLNRILFSEKSTLSISSMDVGQYTTNGYNKVNSASRLLAYRLPVEMPCIVTVASGYSMNYFYGKVNDRASRKSDSTWVPFFYLQNDEAGWLSIVIKRDDNANVSQQDIEDCKLTVIQQPGFIANHLDSGDTGLFTYTGVRPNITNQAKVWRGFNPGNIPLNQDAATYGDYLFAITTTGTFYSYKFSTNQRINNGTQFGRTLHSNSVTFGKEVASGSNFPLLYISDCKNHKLAVYKILGDDTGYSLDFQYDISVTSIDTSVIGVGDSSFFVDGDNNIIYLFRYKKSGYPAAVSKDNGVFISRYPLPAEATVYSENDLIDVVYLDNFDYAAIQGGLVINGQVYVSAGIGPYNTTAHLYVYDPFIQKMITEMNLTSVFPGEPETLTFIDTENVLLFANSGIWLRIRF